MRLRQGLSLGWILLPVLAADRLSKRAALALAPDGARTALPGILSWAYTENRGAAFSLFSGAGALLIALTAALLMGVLLWLMCKPDEPRLVRAGLWLVLGGGLGNLWDRLAYGFVVDFVRLDFVRFAVFNLADVCVCVGVALCLLGALISQERKGRDG